MSKIGSLWVLFVCIDIGPFRERDMYTSPDCFDQR